MYMYKSQSKLGVLPEVDSLHFQVRALYNIYICMYIDMYIDV